MLAHTGAAIIAHTPTQAIKAFRVHIFLLLIQHLPRPLGKRSTFSADTPLLLRDGNAPSTANYPVSALTQQFQKPIHHFSPLAVVENQSPESKSRLPLTPARLLRYLSTDCISLTLSHNCDSQSFGAQKTPETISPFTCTQGMYGSLSQASYASFYNTS